MTKLDGETLGKSSVQPPLDHYNYDELEECHCKLCSDYREALAFYESWKDLRPPRHKPVCLCSTCAIRVQAFKELQATANRRDVYSELSYLVRNHKMGHAFLAWVWEKIAAGDSFKPEAWWSHNAGYRPLRAWMDQWLEETMPRHLWAALELY